MSFDQTFWVACAVWTALCVALADVWFALAVGLFLFGVVMAFVVMAMHLTSEAMLAVEEAEDDGV